MEYFYEENPGIISKLASQKWEFAVFFGAIFFITLSLLTIVDFVPETPAIVAEDSGLVAAEEPDYASEVVEHPLPEQIVIPSIGLTERIENPESTDIAVLDQALLGGAVRYPGSATFADEGNMFLFGHSSYLPSVQNPAFKAFNKIQDLERGDFIYVHSEDREYIYEVSSVKMVDAGEAWVALGGEGKKLTLSTCNSFGKKTDRFVVEADFIRSQAL